MIIRRATMDDAPQMCDILNEVIAIGGTTAYQTSRETGYFERVITGSGAFAHVIEIDGQIMAYQWITPFEAPYLAQIATFAKPGTVQRGMGSALFPHTSKAARDAGYGEIDATIRADNAGGLAYYSKMGFKDIGITKAQPLTDGTPVDRIHKRLKL
jgi:L-amino acid N-acyltransferase YncA